MADVLRYHRSAALGRALAHHAWAQADGDLSRIARTPEPDPGLGREANDARTHAYREELQILASTTGESARYAALTRLVGALHRRGGWSLLRQPDGRWQASAQWGRSRLRISHPRQSAALRRLHSQLHTIVCERNSRLERYLRIAQGSAAFAAGVLLGLLL